ncbi:MAG: glycine--tRNA ligase subunit beta, partial [Caldiserica bacterium]
VNNILNQAEKKGENFFDGVKEEFLEKPEEKKLYDNFLTIKDEYDDILRNKDYYRALRVILKLKKNIDRFFDRVFVMTEDENIRKNRITLLKGIRDEFSKIADLSKIVVEGG